MLKTFFLALAIVILSIYFLFFIDTNTELESIKKTVTEYNATKTVQPNKNDTKKAVELGLESILLQQGENGFQIWRLNATSANITKEQGQIVVDLPHLIYNMPPNNEPLKVTADKGIINQKSQVLNFIGNVVATHKNGSIKGSFLTYNGSAKTMSFTNGAQFFNPTIEGQVSTLTWFINSHLIEALGIVDITFYNSNSTSK